MRTAARLSTMLAVVASTAVMPIGAQPAINRSDAWLFTWTITPTAAGQPVKGGVQVLDVAIRGGVARITVREGALRALTGDQGTMLLRVSDSTLFVINPTRRDVLTGTLGDLGAMMGGPGASAPLEVTGIRSSTRDRGAGAPLVGIPTRRFATRRAELTQRYTLRITAPGMTRELQTEQVVTLDISRELLRLDPGFRIFADQFARAMGLPDTVLRQLRAAERGVPPGFPVRSTTDGMTVAGRDTLRTTTRAELTRLRRETVDTLTFVVPAGFRVTEMRRLMQRRQP